MERPIGVRIVAILTLLSAFALGLLFLLALGVSVVGMGSGLPLTLDNLWYYLPMFFGLFALVSSSLMLAMIRSRFLWYSLLAYWIVLFLYFVPLAVRFWSEYSRGEYAGFQNLAAYQIETLIIVLIPHIYAVGCSTYFLSSKKVLEYFNIITKRVRQESSFGH